LHPSGGILASILTPFKWCMGGVFGDGKQYMSWITLDDMMRAIEFIMNTPSIKGPVNFSSPNPVTNYQFTKTLGKVLWRPTLCWIPKFVLSSTHWVAGEFMQETIVASIRLHPRKLLDSGFYFQDAELEPALKRLLFGLQNQQLIAQ